MRDQIEAIAYVLGVFAVVLGVLAGLFFAVGKRDAGIWITYLTVAVAFGGAFAWYQDRLWKAELRFSAVARVRMAFAGSPLDDGQCPQGIWVTDGHRKAITPTRIAMYLAVTNEGSTPFMIRSYAVEARDYGDEWTKLKQIRSGTGDFYLVFSREKGTKLDFSENAFDQRAKDRNIAPHETLLGWAFFYATRDAVINFKEWRIQLFTMDDRNETQPMQSAAETKLPGSGEEAIQGAGWKIIGQDMDISDFTTKPLSDFQK